MVRETHGVYHVSSRCLLRYVFKHVRVLWTFRCARKCVCLFLLASCNMNTISLAQHHDIVDLEHMFMVLPRI
jgi:hypothetical protein